MYVCSIECILYWSGHWNVDCGGLLHDRETKEFMKTNEPDYEALDFASKRILALSLTVAKQFRALSTEEQVFVTKTLDMLDAVTAGHPARSNLAVMHIGISIMQEQAKSIQEMIRARKAKTNVKG